jgi:hypothetical protein
MAEKFYAFFLRMFPVRFRAMYEEEALQLFRDRVRDEKKLLQRVRLWFDLIVDLSISLPREYWYSGRTEVAGARMLHRTAGVPSFYFVDDELPRMEALACGTVIAVLAAIVFGTALSQVAKQPKFIERPTYIARVMAYGRTSNQAFGKSISREPLRTDSEHASVIADASVSQNAGDLSNDFTYVAAMPGEELDDTERQRVVDAVVANLKKHYAYPDLAQRMANELTAHEKSGQYAELDAGSFADLLTDQMRHISRDQHLELVYSLRVLPPQPHERTPQEAANLREQLKQENCEFERVETLRHNIGYLKLNWFADASACSGTAAAAMASVNRANAIIFDLRDNRGGDPAMVSLVAAYLFDHPEYWYNPRENTTLGSWTHSPVEGNLLADKPVYILTSNRTFSGAEQFCYDLKMLKRATIVGETTGGGAHAGMWHRIDDHFGVAIPEVKPINPYSQPDWEGTGVEPDVNVKAADALEAAVKLAESRSKRN